MSYKAPEYFFLRQKSLTFILNEFLHFICWQQYPSPDCQSAAWSKFVAGDLTIQSKAFSTDHDDTTKTCLKNAGISSK